MMMVPTKETGKSIRAISKAKTSEFWLVMKTKGNELAEGEWFLPGKDKWKSSGFASWEREFCFRLVQKK